MPGTITVDTKGIVGGGKHLKPAQVHELVHERDDVVFFDGRNAHEAAIGKFKNAVVPNVQNTRDSASELANPKYDGIFDKRTGTKFSDKAQDIGIYIHCESKTSNYENCANKVCNKLVLICTERADYKKDCQDCINATSAVY